MRKEKKMRREGAEEIEVEEDMKHKEEEEGEFISTLSCKLPIAHCS